VEGEAQAGRIDEEDARHLAALIASIYVEARFAPVAERFSDALERTMEKVECYLEG
jgi:hypothetical protein